jgi:hypothetical protein
MTGHLQEKPYEQYQMKKSTIPLIALVKTKEIVIAVAGSSLITSEAS